MKIAIVQMHYPKGHQRLDQEYVKILAQDHELIIVDDGKYFPNVFCEKLGLDRIKVPHIVVKRWEFLRRLAHYINLFIVFTLLTFKKKQYDAVLFLNIHNALYFYPWLPNKTIAIFHHQDIDDMIAYPKYYRRFFKVKNRYSHICLADFISEGLVNKTSVNKELVHTVYQPLVFKTDSVIDVDKENLLLGIGNSTDEKIVEELVSLDKGNDVLSSNQLIMRSHLRSYKGKNVTVINGYLSREEYESLYNRAKVSVVTYPSQYKLRYSGIIDDSLAKRLVVFSNDNPCARFFSSKYPSNVIIFKNTQELWELLHKQLPTSSIEESNRFYSAHAAENVSYQLNKALHS